jgi:hypothetical protein
VSLRRLAKVPHRAQFLAIIFLWVAALPVPSLSQSQSQPTNTTRLHKKFAPALPKEAVVPFGVGETLNYRVAWSVFSSAASVQLNAVERRDLYGWATWHFRAVAHTQNAVRNLFAIDDQFDSYTDAVSLQSRQYEMHLNEMGRTEDDVLHFAVAGEASYAPPPLAAVEPGTRDPLGLLYALRAASWSVPEFRAPVYDGHDLYAIIAKRESTGETVKVAAGSFTASRIAIRIFRDGQEVPAIRFVVWLADDAAKTPVVLQAELPFGNVRAEFSGAK